MENVLHCLLSTDVTTVAETIRALRFHQLKEPHVLAALLSRVASSEPISGAEVAVDDPFSAFFSDRPTTKAVTIGDKAMERLLSMGLPGGEIAVAAIEEVLADHPHIGAQVLKLASDTRFEEEDAWPRVLAALKPTDPSIMPLLAKLPHGLEAKVVASAIFRPFWPRAANEMLMNEPTRDVAAATIADEVVADPDVLPEESLAELLALLTAWDHAVVSQICAMAPYDWVQMFAAVGVPDARTPLAEWLEAAPPDPMPVRRVLEVLQQKPRLENYPLDLLLRIIGRPHVVLETWGVQAAEAAVLLDWLREWTEGEGAHDPIRLLGWLASSDELDEVRALLADHVDSLELDAAAATTAIRCGIEGVVERATQEMLAAAEEPGPWIAALQHAPALARHTSVERYLELAEARPVVELPAKAGLRHTAREGTDLDALEPLLAGADAKLLARWEALRPLLTAVD